MSANIDPNQIANLDVNTLPKDDPIREHLEQIAASKPTIRLASQPIKLKDKDGRQVVTINLLEMFGELPEVIYIQKIHGENNKFFLLADVTDPNLKGGDINMEDPNKAADEAPKTNEPGDEGTGPQNNPDANVSTPGTINDQDPTPATPVVGESNGSPGPDQAPNTEAPAPVSDTPSVPAAGSTEPAATQA